MIKFLKIFALIILSPFLLISIIALFIPPYYEALFMLLPVGVCFVFLIRSFSQEKKRKQQIEAYSNRLKQTGFLKPVLLRNHFSNLNDKGPEEAKNTNEKDRHIVDFREINTNRILFQAFETAQIIESSKNLETIFSRYEFFEKLMNELGSVVIVQRLATDITKVLDEYRSLYYNTIITDTQLYIVSHPNDVKNRNEWYWANLVRALQDFANAQIEQCAGLKQMKAIERRIQKILDTAELTKEELYRLQAPQEYVADVDCIIGKCKKDKIPPSPIE